MSAVQMNPTRSELRWHCRRGMLELDLLLNEFLDDSYARLSTEEKTRFEKLLEYPDQTLFDLLMGKMQSSDNALNRIIKKINMNLVVQG